MGDDGCPLVHPIGEDEGVAEAVVLAVAEVTGKEAVPSDDELAELEELYNGIDPDALDALFRGAETDANLVFSWEGCEIEIDGGTHVIVTELE